VPTSSNDIKKIERKSGFTIPKKIKKTSDLNPNDTAIISSNKTSKITDKRNESQNPLLPPPTPSSSTVAASINNLLSTKQLEPVQVHSVGQQSKQQQSVIQSVSVRTLLNNSSSSSSNTKISQLSDEIRLVLQFYRVFSTIFIFYLSRTMMMQSPRKKRDFYGKSSGPSTTPSSSRSSTSSPNTKSHRHMNTTDSSSTNNNRPSSTPACTATISAPTLPDRPVSIPPLKSSS